MVPVPVVRGMLEVTVGNVATLGIVVVGVVVLGMLVMLAGVMVVPFMALGLVVLAFVVLLTAAFLVVLGPALFGSSAKLRASFEATAAAEMPASTEMAAAAEGRRPARSRPSTSTEQRVKRRRRAQQLNCEACVPSLSKACSARPRRPGSGAGKRCGQDMTKPASGRRLPAQRGKKRFTGRRKICTRSERLRRNRSRSLKAPAVRA